MSISNINSSIRNQYPQINTPSVNKTADPGVVPTKSSSTTAASDTVTISMAGQAIASTATGFTTMLQAFDPGRALTEDDKALIGYPNFSNPYVTSMAATISALRESGHIQGKMTSAYVKDDVGGQFSVFDLMPKDKQSQAGFAPLKNRMMAKFAEYKNDTVDASTKLANEKFLLSLGRDVDATTAALSVPATGTDSARRLTLEDMVLIGYPDPSDPNVAILAEGISQARETGQLQGPMTEAFLKGGNAQYKFGLFDMLPSDPASLKSSAKTKKAVLDRLHGVKDTKEADLNKMLRKAGFLHTAETDAAQTIQSPPTQTPKLKAMLRDYSAYSEAS